MTAFLTPLTPLSSYEDALAFLDGLDVSAMKLGLARVEKVLETMGNPQDALAMVHIAGTNGKGSVTTMLASILKAAGLKVGTFTSPHLIHVRERIAINGNPILPDEFQEEVNALKLHLERLQWPREDWPTYFEFLNILAYRYFKRKNVDVTIFETGLGGRLDSTNVVRHPNLTVITTIGMDHMQHLGNTLSAIATEKAGILKTGTPLVMGGGIPEEASDVICGRAEMLSVPVYQADLEALVIEEHSNPAEGLLVQNAATGQQYLLSLPGPYQRDNLATVLASIQRLREQGYRIEEAAVVEGLRQTHWPVRFQYLESESMLLDGSHNADGFKTLADGLRLYFSGRPLIWLVSLRANRNPDMLAGLMREFPLSRAVVVTRSEPVHLYHDPAELAGTLRQICFGVTVETAPAPDDALKLARNLQVQAAPDHPLLVVTGSLYTAGAVLHHMQT